MKKIHLRWNNFLFTAVVAFAAGMVAHGFALTNVLQNYDNINASLNGFGCGVESGRWFLTFLSMFMHKFFGGYNLPWFNGIVTILVLSVAAALVVHTFQFEKRISAALTGILFVVFPTVSSTLFFRFVSLYDACACLLAIFAAYIIPKKKWGIVLSAVSTAVSMGIYQAYFPMTVTMLLLLLLQMHLRGDSARDVRKSAVRALVGLIAGLLAYFLAQKATQAVLHSELLEYQGISKMGALRLTELPAIVWNAYRTFLTFPVRDYCSLTPNLLAVVIVVMLWVLSLAAVVAILVSGKSDFVSWLQVGGILLLLPVSIGLIEIMAPESSVYTLMVYSYVFVFIAPLVIMEALPDTPVAARRFRAISGATLIGLSLASVNYIYLDNVNYTSMYYATEQTENYMNALVTQVRMTQGYRADQAWAFVGSRFSDPLIAPEWSEAPYYGGSSANYINTYSRMRWINTYLGCDIPLAEETVVQELMQLEQVKEMPCFPDQGSIQIINDVVVIKLANENAT